MIGGPRYIISSTREAGAKVEAHRPPASQGVVQARATATHQTFRGHELQRGAGQTTCRTGCTRCCTRHLARWRDGSDSRGGGGTRRTESSLRWLAPAGHALLLLPPAHVTPPLARLTSLHRTYYVLCIDAVGRQNCRHRALCRPLVCTVAFVAAIESSCRKFVGLELFKCVNWYRCRSHASLALHKLMQFTA